MFNLQSFVDANYLWEKNGEKKIKATKFDRSEAQQRAFVSYCVFKCISLCLQNHSSEYIDK